MSVEFVSEKSNPTARPVAYPPPADGSLTMPRAKSRTEIKVANGLKIPYETKPLPAYLPRPRIFAPREFSSAI
ncbi:MAG: hypothetical protein UX49_C0018G0016 [Candidatus Wolfebacteria bacterium GW2011_GWC2_46_275]|uniref:Uncharacterized protein n=2 Tax=Candidatus Wolfeibacteriota TaxID=1752735 RepID=A0A0G1U6J4_9BACT|nr:MAG: hypothetical protein UX70_C0001G0339 [Candidatus Wolfebacteria bacterium GW2011_GWB1_47_1]KKU36319.1 MAG: hypothetical protein UX49_C0018G0016 [Candidatus Wolfebacteria bacterium GW2011_GWC2_46_275]KKU41871.1 MAG: hypothetical protein UX58_C0005G0021 [Candidatus Wolfebacteria bacterium GW2011_GWB2_46_69]KKU54148.1 MAG: hypothetical protein UX76_C0005G0021 [Candidatus Wolfebacteria bacterium GW2011_GWC1_47_103]KKU59071.1 MAG: hypothetical protein UX83_C0008G0021 [Candidatus Wolfebacteria